MNPTIESKPKAAEAALQVHAVQPATPNNSLSEKLIAVALPHLKFLEEGASLGLNDSLAETGLDSMASINLLLDIEDELDLSIPDELIEEDSFESVAKLCALVESVKNA